VLPLAAFADADGVDVGVEGNQLLTLARFADLAQQVAQAIDPDFVERARVFHFLLDAFDDGSFLGGLGGDGDHVAQEADHGLFIVAGRIKIGTGFWHCISRQWTAGC
jgi:hypothetical protein